MAGAARVRGPPGIPAPPRRRPPRGPPGPGRGVGRHPPRLLARYPNLRMTKLRLIDYCFEQLDSRSFADLGGVWGIDGAYARYAADAHAPERGVVIDENFTERYLELERDLRGLTHLPGNFGEPEVARSLG